MCVNPVRQQKHFWRIRQLNVGCWEEADLIVISAFIQIILQQALRWNSLLASLYFENTLQSLRGKQ
jgi:hypothetical protein